MASGTEPEDYRGIFWALTEAGLPYFVEGGQAVNIWANVFVGVEPSLEEYLPFTSKDCDLWVGAQTFRKIRLGRILEGSLVVGDSPADGQLGIFTTDERPVKVIDLMQGVFGIPPEQIEKAYKRSLNLSGVRVLDPLFLFKGKCHNYVKLDQKTRQDEKHLRMLALILPAYFLSLLNEAKGKNITQRQLIHEVKLLQSFFKDGWVRQALKALSLSLDSMIPIEAFKGCNLSTVRRFAQQNWPGSSE